MEYTEAEINKMKVPELKEALKAKGLPTSGNKAELVARLIAGKASADGPSKKAATKRKREAESNDSDDGEAAEKEVEDTRPAKKGKAKKASEDEEEEEEQEESTAGSGSGGIVESLSDEGWKELLANEFEKPYFKHILKYVAEQRKQHDVFPPDHEVLNALNYTPFDQVKVVIIGQDPYFQPNQAHGLCFSVKKGVKLPPSLRNIYKELEADIKGFKVPTHGYLEEWARQGVLMLNATLTVNQGKANSHEKCGWQTFTDRILELVNEKKEGVVFLLWGQFAIKKAKGVDKTKHHVLEAPHPSPLAKAKFQGCKHFSQCNELLKKMGKDPIDWKLSP